MLETTFRKDMFGNLIEKGTKKHKIMFRDNNQRENDPMLPKVELLNTTILRPSSEISHLPNFNKQINEVVNIKNPFYS